MASEIGYLYLTMKLTLFLENGERLDVETEDYEGEVRMVMEYLIETLAFYENENSELDKENETLIQEVEYRNLLSSLLKPEIKN